MVLGAEIGMLAMGLYALVTGKLILTKKRVVRGAAARLLALFALMPLPMTVIVAVVLGFLAAMLGMRVDEGAFKFAGIFIELTALVLSLIAVYAIGWAVGSDPADDPL
jgi:hypothetical protein